MSALLGSRDENIIKQGGERSDHSGWLKQHERPAVHQQGIGGNHIYSLPSHRRTVCLAHTELPVVGGTQLLESIGTHLGDAFLCMDCDCIRCFCKMGQGLGCLSAHSTPSH